MSRLLSGLGPDFIFLSEVKLIIRFVSTWNFYVKKYFVQQFSSLTRSIGQVITIPPVYIQYTFLLTWTIRMITENVVEQCCFVKRIIYKLNNLWSPVITYFIIINYTVHILKSLFVKLKINISIMVTHVPSSWWGV